ncbi:hypothetical protein NUV66_11455 [Pseudomonas sp. 32.2.56]|uniref:hypothetical protein n=1 Tax=Pseudomonas sp. 32.2.56 TaxID=2969303 RepID=UPI0021504846|nr:hypothetical protein [Pseudomonas sp. 32.2.56]MCR4509929.1 hypothetical protein [Pseudomonas sp. 32.2.56]
MNDEKRSHAEKWQRPFGLRLKTGHAVLRDLPREHHYLHPAPCLACFQAATQK